MHLQIISEVKESQGDMYIVMEGTVEIFADSKDLDDEKVCLLFVFVFFLWCGFLFPPFFCPLGLNCRLQDLSRSVVEFVSVWGLGLKF